MLESYEGLTFRILTVENAKSVRNLNKAAYPKMAESENYWEEVVAKNETNYCLGAFYGEELIGAVTAVRDLIRSPTGKLLIHPEERLLLQNYRKVSYISHLMVRQQWRRRQIATKLLRKTMEKLREKGTEAFCLHTHSGNLAAIRLYEKLGFENEAVYTQERDNNAMFYVYKI